MEPFIGEVRMFAGNFAPRGWAFCNGQLMPIAANTALFSLLGATYGGDGKSTFALPDLRGRVPIHAGVGAGPGLTPYSRGESSGVPAVTLIQTEMPAHSHNVSCGTASNQDTPAGGLWSSTARGGGSPYATTTDGTLLSPLSVTPTGEGLPHNNMQPYLGVSFIIALQGLFPPRS